MALNGSVAGTVYNKNGAVMSTAQLWIYWENIPNAKTNKSTTNRGLYLSSTGGTWNNVPFNGTFNGNAFSGRVSLPNNGTPVLLASDSLIDQQHNPDGSFGFEVSATFSRTDSTTTTGTPFSGSVANTYQAPTSIDRTAPAVSLSISNITNSGIMITANASTTCDIWQYSLDNGSTWITFDSTEGTSKSYSITGLTPGTTYNVKVKARKSINQVYGTSATTAAKTLGNSTFNAVNMVIADAETVEVVFNVTVYNTGYTHALAVKNGSSTLFTISGLSLNSGANTITLTAAQRAALLSAMPNAKSFSGTFELISYDGGTQIGNVSTATAAITTTAANSTPVFSGFSYADINTTSEGVTENDQILIKGISNLRVVAAAATAKNGATISSYSAIAGEKAASSTTETLNIGIINTAGTIPITVTVIDSRGYTASATVNITVIDYESIEITAASMRRVNEIEATTQIEVSGELSAIIINLVNKNAFQSFQYRYKKTSETEYSPWYTVTATYTDTGFEYTNNEFVSLNADYSYNLQVLVSDKLTSYSETLTIPQGTPLLAFRRKMIGINTQSPAAALDVYGDIYKDGANIFPLSIGRGGLGGTTIGQAQTNLGISPLIANYSGAWSTIDCNLTDTNYKMYKVFNATNAPVTGVGILEHKAWLGDNGYTSFVQNYYSVEPTNLYRKFTRSKYIGGTWTPWRDVTPLTIEAGMWSYSGVSTWTSTNITFSKVFRVAPVVVPVPTTLFSSENMAITARSATGFTLRVYCSTAGFTFAGYWIAFGAV